jgi:hypothetical protein
MVRITLTEAEAEELMDLMETAIGDIENERFWPAEEPEDATSKEQKLAAANALFDRLSNQVWKQM